MKASNVEQTVIGIFSASLKNWLVFITLTVVLYISSSRLLSFVLFCILLYALHKAVNKNADAITKFMELKKAVFANTATYINRSKSENVFHNIAVFPISLGLTVLMATNNIGMIISSIIIVYFILIYGETAKYRYKLYKTYYDNHIA
ncbi:MAG: hypothetical protein KBT36_12955 [Kurthia sp.]|nr:hypothetical protein [Candidatus Kurthia equi]